MASTWITVVIHGNDKELVAIMELNSTAEPYSSQQR